MRALSVLLGLTSVLTMNLCMARAEQSRTVTVTGTGTVTAQPSFVVIMGTIKGSGKSGADAKTKFRKVKEKVTDALVGDKIPKLTVDFKGEKVTKSSAMGGAAAAAVFAGGGGAVADEMSVSERVLLKIRFENDMERMHILDKVVEVMDKASEAGAQFGQQSNLIRATYGLASSIVEFGLDDESVLRSKAYQAAMKNARFRAEELAKLSNGKLGRVVSVEELAFAVKDESSIQAVMLSSLGGDSSSAEPETLTSDENHAIEHRQSVRVVFELLD